MLKLLRRWLGWEAGDNPFGGGTRPTAATRDVLSGKVTPRADGRRPAPSARQRQPAGRAAGARPALGQKAEDRFDPYNTGAFNRSASWERISRSGR